ncbi:AAA family ATPase [Citromicrobium sp. JLT1363]|uniref:AAA family ATPase n=1 Tax=Citromicrobium sp. JLT1363 TaxID=517722 RepID=UPI00031F3586|nr:AAA family ATPase [Citromicrobium sp. JLT1363]
MKLSHVYARFYKSFNFDHRRKAHPKAEKREWEMIGSLWYPYVEVPIDQLITTIVGANESGKSHLLSAIEKAITGEGFQHQDLCRYCDFFNVERGNEFWPHLGVSWIDLDANDVTKIRSEVSEAPEKFDSFLMFREGPERLNLYFPDGSGSYVNVSITGDAAREFGSVSLPRAFRLESKTALPAALPTSELLKAENAAPKNRASRKIWMKAADMLFEAWPGDKDRFAGTLPSIAPGLASILSEVNDQSAAPAEELKRSYELARKLLMQLANIEPERLVELAQYIEAGENGHATALAESINQQLEKKLNFPKYWVQDRDFQLRVTALESELVFTIRDRTGTQYTFDERSAGLKYFLSYFIQAQTHIPDPTRPEILLMDEPDAYLSAEAQQDLLKIFRNFAEPDGDTRPVQVVYVTHSPFLLDKNHAERIRVLEKGKGEDGTRVIRNASQNHYEPLRSAFGAFVGETAFIGACNLLVEGVADQVLLAGLSRVILNRGANSETELLDLNRVVMVPCGSASHVPYMLYLIRGRDSEAPSVVVLLDSDESGKKSAEILRKDDKQTRRLINSKFIMQFDELNIVHDTGHRMEEPEDLIPAPLAVAAANLYFREVAEFREGEALVIQEEDVSKALGAKVGIYDALKKAADAKGGHIDKIGFARAVVTLCENAAEKELQSDIDEFIDRMKELFKKINRNIRAANEERYRHRAKSMVEQHRKIFIQDHPEGATREQGLFLFERIGDGLDNSLDSKAMRDMMRELTADFKLDGEANEPIPDFDDFVSKLRMLKDALEYRRTSIESEEVARTRKPSAKNKARKKPKAIAADERGEDITPPPSAAQQ